MLVTSAPVIMCWYIAYIEEWRWMIHVMGRRWWRRKEWLMMNSSWGSSIGCIDESWWCCSRKERHWGNPTIRVLCLPCPVRAGDYFHTLSYCFSLRNQRNNTVLEFHKIKRIKKEVKQLNINMLQLKTLANLMRESIKKESNHSTLH